MNVSLTPELRQFVESHVASGRYESASEVIRQSLRVLEQWEKADEAYWAEVRAKVAEAQASIARGEGRDGDEAMDELERELFGEAPVSAEGNPTR
jgi:antitoxin ParD1/3/4